MTDPESSSIKMVLAGKPRLSCSVIGTETIFMAVVEREGIRDGMKRMLWEEDCMERRWGELDSERRENN